MHSHLARAVTLVVLALAPPVFPDGAPGPAQARPAEHLVAAHYYPWFDAGRWSYSECATGAVRLDLAPAQPPLLGRYDSSSEAVVDQHLRWCAEHDSIDRTLAGKLAPKPV